MKASGCGRRLTPSRQLSHLASGISFRGSHLRHSQKENKRLWSRARYLSLPLTNHHIAASLTTPCLVQSSPSGFRKWNASHKSMTHLRRTLCPNGMGHRKWSPMNADTRACCHPRLSVNIAVTPTSAQGRNHLGSMWRDKTHPSHLKYCVRKRHSSLKLRIWSTFRDHQQTGTLAPWPYLKMTPAMSDMRMSLPQSLLLERV